MKDKVVIYIKGLHDSSDNECVEAAYTGKYYMKDGIHFVEYEEDFGSAVESYNESGNKVDAGGESYISNNVISISNKEVQVIRQGQMSNHMVFSLDGRNESYYDTPFGSMTVGIETSDIHLVESDSEIKVSVRYFVEISGQPMGESNVEIRIVEV